MAFSRKELMQQMKRGEEIGFQETATKAQGSYKPRHQFWNVADVLFDLFKLAKPLPPLQAIGYAGDIGLNLFDQRKYEVPDKPKDSMFSNEAYGDMIKKLRIANEQIQKKKELDIATTLAQFGLSEIAEPGREWLQGKMGETTKKGQTMLSEMTKDTMLGTAKDNLVDRVAKKFPDLFKDASKIKYTDVNYSSPFTRTKDITDKLNISDKFKQSNEFLGHVYDPQKHIR